MTTTRPWTQSDSHLDSPTSQLLWLRKLSRGDRGMTLLAKGTQEQRQGAHMLMLGKGQSELKVGKSAQSSLAPRKGMGVTRSREDLREGDKVCTNTTSMSSGQLTVASNASSPTRTWQAVLQHRLWQ